MAKLIQLTAKTMESLLLLGSAEGKKDLLGSIVKAQTAEGEANILMVHKLVPIYANFNVNNHKKLEQQDITEENSKVSRSSKYDSEQTRG